ncbi:hypothetical protein GF377_05765 [candidate division GN15 bacterium]|nr:hypothetical protein [candidate division GN15 bacterium]
MAQKRASFMTYGSDERSEAIRKFIEDAGVQLQIRDWQQQPPTVDELDRLLGHIPMKYFVNPASPSYEAKKLDEQLPSRGELLQMMADDPSLLRRPIIKTTRLITVGFDKKKIAEMLQLNGDSNTVGEGPREQPRRTNHGNQRRPVSSRG